MPEDRRRLLGALLLILALSLGIFAFRSALRSLVRRLVSAALGTGRSRTTVAQRVAQFGAAVESRLSPDFDRAGLSWPPAGLALLGFKQERVLEAWIPDAAGRWRLLKRYPILGASGLLGPKLREGDCQVPEGLYRVESLNPNSLYHLALRIDYPNPADRELGAAEGRECLGGDIMIHGNTCSIGCLAMGDGAAEELFVMAAWARHPQGATRNTKGPATNLEQPAKDVEAPSNGADGMSKTSPVFSENGETGDIPVILSPVDFRVRDLPAEMPPVPDWMGEVYERLRAGLGKYR